MTITQTFNYAWPEGTTPITFIDWIKTLTQEEQDEFAQALARQDALRQKAIDDGMLELDPNGEGYVWKDYDTLTIGKPQDETWLVYWDKWKNATGVQFSYSVLQTLAPGPESEE